MAYFMKTVALIIGSLAKNSLNRKVATAIVAHAPEDINVIEVKIDDLPLYTQDLDETSIASYDRVRAALKQADAVLIVSPEHNRSMPAALKNVIDIGSRPFGQSIWAGKKVGVVTASPGNYGGLVSGLHIRESLSALAAQLLIAPEVYLSRANAAFDEAD